MSQASVKVVDNWRNKLNKSGLYSIHLRITIAGKQKYYLIQVPLKVSSSQWNGEPNAWVKNNHPFFFEINNRIRVRQNVVLDLIARYYKSTNGLTFAIIFKELKKSLNTDLFNEFFEYYINHPSENLQLDTLKKYKACLDHLNHFNKKIRFIDLSSELVRDFYDYCRSTEKLAGSTIDSYFDSFKKIVRLARQSHHISKQEEDSLFEDLHIDIKKPKRTYLTIEEIRRWKNLVFGLPEYHLQRDRDIFFSGIYRTLL